ncbi:MAG: AtpZ/AtpI family protein [Oscillospiraceae bacterium]|nr:AtpZ/AtpI family protein [Oscillospiraceae bacterium]
MKDSGDRRSVIRALGLLTQLGISMAVCVFIGFGAGVLLDRYLGTGPWLLIVFSLIGAGASFKVMYDLAIKGWEK